MLLYAVTGTLTDVNGAMSYFMPSIKVGMFFSATMAVVPNAGTPNVSTAYLHILAGGDLVNANSVGLHPLQSFADHTPTGPLSSPTVQHGAYIDNAYFTFAIEGASLGTLGFSVQGKGPDGTSKAGAVSGRMTSITVVP
jgi:hypothetical protein